MNRAMNAEPNPYAPEDRRHYLYNSFTQYGSANAGQLNDHVAVDVAPGIKPVIVYVDADGNEAPVSEKSGRGEFDVVLTGLWNSKVRVIEAVRSITNLGLKEATELVEGVPRLLKERVSKDEAEQLKAEMEAAGAFCEIK
jgi:large subunit ribosomal protein L7/L12